MIEIRQATADDATLIALLGRVTFIESHSNFVKNDIAVQNFCDTEFDTNKIKQDLQDENQLFWLLFYNNFPVGLAKAILNKSNELLTSDKVCKLDKIYILNDFIQHKLGRKLHDEVIKKVHELHFEYIWLVTYVYNYRAIQFYKNNDYKKSGFIDFIVDGKGYKNHIMIKNLRE